MTKEELLKDAKPIRFNTEEVRATLDGRKTVKRLAAFHCDGLRKIDLARYPNGWWFKGRVYKDWDSAMKSAQGVLSFCKYKPEDILYVQERFCKGNIEYGEEPDGREVPYVKQYVGDSDIIPYEYCIRENIGIEDVIWRPSIHMPKEAARIFLRVTDVRVERLKDITPEQIIAEGITEFDSELLELLEEHYDIPFAFLWDKTIPKKDFEKYRWQANPWVWVIEFERMVADENVN